VDNRRYWRIAVTGFLVSGIFGLIQVAAGEESAIARWYTGQQVEQGKTLYLAHCIACHNQQATGTTEWRRTGADGNYPPPPLNGTAHAWHHALSVLERSIAQGGVPNGGVMPGFAATLSQQEIRATIAYFQSFWPDEIYARWHAINNR